MPQSPESHSYFERDHKKLNTNDRVNFNYDPNVVIPNLDGIVDVPRQR